jgi:hypothetical protein
MKTQQQNSIGAAPDAEQKAQARLDAALKKLRETLHESATREGHPTPESKLLLLLPYPHPLEVQFRRPLCHDAGKMLVWILERHKIPRERWSHTYCFWGLKKALPTRKDEREETLRMDREQLASFFATESPGEVVALGKLPCEIMTGDSILKHKSCTCWRPLPVWQKLGIKRVWITHSAQEALYKPDLAVDIAGVLCTAAKKLGLQPRCGPPQPGEPFEPFPPEPFDWFKYQGERGRSLGGGEGQ